MLRNILSVVLISIFTQCIWANESIVIVGHASLQKTDLATLQRLYTGRIVSLNQQAAIPLNLPAGSPVRQRFLNAILGQSEEQYSGYWLVRRYVGKGVPPQEVASPEEILRMVGTTPGAVGYVPASKVPAGSNILYSP